MAIDEYGNPLPLTWKTMQRWQRKQWHRTNDLRRSRNLQPLSKPGVCP